MQPATGDLVSLLRAAGCVFAEDEARLLRERAADPAELSALAARRIAGEPLEQVLGFVDFCGLRIAVAAGVFVPRQRSAYLVREAARRTAPGATVLDMCCGNGALGLALDRLAGGVVLHAADVSPAAVAVARRNVGDRGVVHESELFAQLPDALRGRVDTLLANVPYVPSAAIADLPREARDHEPRAALDGGPDGLDVLRLVAVDAGDWLAPGGHLLVETGSEQASTAVRILRDAGLRPEVMSDDDEPATVVIGTRPVGS